jgi:hypothetical protein
MALPTIVIWVIAFSIMGDDYVWEETGKMRPADVNSVATPSLPTLAWESRPTWHSIYKQQWETKESMRAKVQRMVRKYHTPDWIIHYDLAPGMQLELALMGFDKKPAQY